MPYLRLNLWILGFILSLCACSSDYKEEHVSSSLGNNCIPSLSHSYTKSLKMGAFAQSGFKLANELEKEIIHRIRGESNFPLLTRMEMICMTESSINILPRKEDIDKVIQILREFEKTENRELIQIMSDGKIESQEFYPNGKISSQRKTALDAYDRIYTQSLNFDKTGDTTNHTIYQNGFFGEKEMILNPNQIRIAAISLNFDLAPRVYFSLGPDVIYKYYSDNDFELNTIPEGGDRNLPIHMKSNDKLYKIEDGKWTVKEIHERFSQIGTMDFRKKTWTQKFENPDTILTEILFELDLDKESESRYIWRMKNKELIRGFHSNGVLSFEYDLDKMVHKEYDKNSSLLSINNEIDLTDNWFNDLWGIPDILDY